MPIQNIYKKLKDARTGRKMTQQQMSDFLGLPQGYISQVEAGKHDIRLSTLTDWARVLGYEFMLIPKRQVAEISYLLQAGPIENVKQIPPAYGPLPNEVSNE